MNTVILSHYYTTPDVQQMSDYVGDSLDLAISAGESNPDRIVFAGVRFMAETAKILNPQTEVILPDKDSSCSLVEQTDIEELKLWIADHKEKAKQLGKELVHVSYINSSVEHKALSDFIVTSRIVDDVIKELYRQNKYVIFSPDYNMGAYLNYTYGYGMPVWTAVCEVHDKFKAAELDEAMKEWTDGGKYVIAHPESPLPILKKADYVGSTKGMLDWITAFEPAIGTIWVATEDGLLYNMKKLRPELDIRQAPMYSGCQCNSCPFMKLNTAENVRQAADFGIGETIEISDELIEQARLPIERMMEFQRTGQINL